MPIRKDTRPTTADVIHAPSVNREQHRWLGRRAMLPRGRCESANPERCPLAPAQHRVSVAHGPGTSPESSRASFVLCFRKAPRAHPFKGTLARRCQHRFIDWLPTSAPGANPQGRAGILIAVLPRVVAKNRIQELWHGVATTTRSNGPRWRFQAQVQNGVGSNPLVVADCPPLLPSVNTLCRTSPDVSKTA